MAETPPQGVRAPKPQTLLGVGPPSGAAEPEEGGPPLLPGTKTEYSAPRAPPAAQHAADPVASSTIEVSDAAQVSRSTRESEEEPEPHSLADARSAATLDTVPPRARATSNRGRIAVFAALGAASALLGFAALMRFAGTTERVTSGTPSAPAVTAAAVAPAAPNAATGVEPATVPSPETSAAEVEPAAAPPGPEGGGTQTGADNEHQVEPKTPAPVPVQLSALPKRVETPSAAPKGKTTPRASSPRAAAGGSIVRESPF